MVFMVRLLGSQLSDSTPLRCVATLPPPTPAPTPPIPPGLLWTGERSSAPGATSKPSASQTTEPIYYMWGVAVCACASVCVWSTV